MKNTLNRPELAKRYSQGYLNLLEENPWIQSYIKPKKLYDFYNELCLPSLSLLWRLAETMLPVDPDNEDVLAEISGRITLHKDKNNYVATLKMPKKKLEFKGECPEEAMLKLFIKLENF